jgi:acetyl esterase/lipase
MNVNRSIHALCAAAVLLAAGVEAESIGERVADRAEVGDAVQAVGLDSFARASVEFPGGVVGFPNLTYQTLPGYRPMTLDLFLPPPKFNAAGPRPWVMYVHGGGWLAGGPRRSAAYLDWPKVLASLAEQGYVVTSVGYRFSREAPFPAAIQDVKAAIRWLRANAARYNLDPGRGMTMGQSAGGHLAALAATSCGVAALEPPGRVVPKAGNVETTASNAEGADRASDCVRGAVAWFGVYDFGVAYRQRPAASASVPDVMDLFLDCTGAPCSDSKLREASPITYVDGSDPPIFLMHGGTDTTVAPDQSHVFEAALRDAGVRTQLVVIPEVGHSWVGTTPPATHAASRQALQQSIDFIESIIGDSVQRR